MDAFFSNYTDWETAIFVDIFKETFKVMESKQRKISKHNGFFSQKNSSLKTNNERRQIYLGEQRQHHLGRGWG